MLGSTTKSKSALTPSTLGTPLRRKKSVMLDRSFLRNSSALGWSCSTDWETSMTKALPSWYRRLNSLRSPCTRRQRW